MKYELETPKKLLLEKTGWLPKAFAFPFDTTTATATTLARAAGYQYAVSRQSPQRTRGRNRTTRTVSKTAAGLSLFQSVVVSQPDRVEPAVFPR